MAPETPLHDRPHTLYRFFDEAGELLYIGITWNPMIRWHSHESTKDWWLEARTSTFEHFPNRKAVFEAERVAIKAEKPKHNIVHAGKPRKSGSAVITFPADFRHVTTGMFHLAGANYVLQLRWRSVKGKLEIDGMGLAACDMPARDGFPEVTGLGDGGELTQKVFRSGALGIEERRARRALIEQMKSAQAESANEPLEEQLSLL